MNKAMKLVERLLFSSLTRGFGKGFKDLFLVAVASAAFLTTPAQAQGTNSVIYLDNFQQFAAGTQINNGYSYVPASGALAEFSRLTTTTVTMTNLSGSIRAAFNCPPSSINTSWNSYCAYFAAPQTNKILQITWQLYIKSVNSGTYGGVFVQLPIAGDESAVLMFNDGGQVFAVTNVLSSLSDLVSIGSWSARVGTVMTNSLLLNYPARTMTYSLNGTVMATYPMRPDLISSVNRVNFEFDEDVAYGSIGNIFAVDEVKVETTGTPSLDGSLDGTGMAWTTGGPVPWFGQTTNTHDGVDAAQSGAVTHSQESWIQTTVTGPGTLTYWQKVSSESSYDYLEFYLDGVLQTGRISGEISWQQKTNSISAGAHTVKWRYMKDNIVSSGQDAGWVDQVSFVPESPIPQIITQPISRTNAVGTTATFNVAVSGGLPLSYQWRKNGTNLTNVGNISGVTTTNLTITNVQTNDAGSFSVVVTNTFGSVTSSVAVLTVADVKVVNLVVAQRPGTKLMDITYDVSSTTANAVWISLTVSNGASKVTATNLTGAVGAGVPVGTGKSMVWNMGTDWNGNVATLSFSVMADDGQTQSVSAPCPVAKTGQTTSYCAGDDGNLRMGVAWPNPRFTVITNGTDQTVIDNLTGLEWVQSPHSLSGNSGTKIWTNAIYFCNDLVYAGHSDWRLPNVKELESLVDYENFGLALPAGHPFAGVRGGSHVYYWSGTYCEGTALAWFVYMTDGYLFETSMTYSYNVWPVRGGQ